MTYDSTILGEANLTAYFKFNETSGTNIVDSSSNAFNGTLNGGVTLNQTAIAAGLDTCFLFNGSTGYISLPTGVNVAEPISVEMWIQGVTVSANAMFYSSNTTSGFEFGWHQSSSNHIFIAGHGGNFDSTNTLVTGTTFYLALTIDTSNNFTIYAGKVGTDSSPQSVGSGNPGGAPTYSGNARIGCASDNSTFFDGYISSVAIYNAVLSSGQRNTHYTNGTTAPGGAAPSATMGLMGVG